MPCFYERNPAPGGGQRLWPSLNGHVPKARKSPRKKVARPLDKRPRGLYIHDNVYLFSRQCHPRRLSNKAEYAVRAILDLALRREQELVHIADIAERTDIPLKFLEQILLALKAAGIV